MLLKANADAAGELAQVCVSCVELFNRAKAQIDSTALFLNRPTTFCRRRCDWMPTNDSPGAA